MYEYNCKIVKVVDGDTVDVDIDLGFGFDALVGHLLPEGPFAGVLLDRPCAGTRHDRAAAG